MHSTLHTFTFTSSIQTAKDQTQANRIWTNTHIYTSTNSNHPDMQTGKLMKHWRQMNEWSNIPTAGLSSCGCSSIIQSASVFTLKHVLSASTQYEVILVHVHITSWHTAGSQSKEQWIYNTDIHRFISSPRSSHLPSVIVTTLIILHPIILLFQPQNFSWEISELLYSFFPVFSSFSCHYFLLFSFLCQASHLSHNRLFFWFLIFFNFFSTSNENILSFCLFMC